MIVTEGRARRATEHRLTEIWHRAWIVVGFHSSRYSVKIWCAWIKLRVSTVAPVNIQEKGGSGHKAKEQSTRVPLGPDWTEEYYCVRENRVDLRGGVHAQQSLPPSLRAVANCVARNSSLNGKPVVAVPKLLPQKVIGEVSIPKPCPGEIKLINCSSEVIVIDVVLPRSNYFNAKANASSSRVSQFLASATSLSRSCTLGQEFVQL